MELKRMRFDQPSTLQTFHERHGEHVLAYKEEGTKCHRVYPLSGPTVSERIPSAYLVEGW